MEHHRLLWQGRKEIAILVVTAAKTKNDDVAPITFKQGNVQLTGWAGCELGPFEWRSTAPVTVAAEANWAFKMRNSFHSRNTRSVIAAV